MFLKPDDSAAVVYEFFAPFAHVPGKYEWCRIRSPTHGLFDCFVLLGPTTSHAATVFVNSAVGAAFMKERYPECTTIRVLPQGLTITESADGRTVTGTLDAQTGPIRKATMSLRAPPGIPPKNVPYGGDGKPVWGGRYTCWGVDLVLDGSCEGTLEWESSKKESLRGVPCIVTLGSFGRIAPR